MEFMNVELMNKGHLTNIFESLNDIFQGQIFVNFYLDFFKDHLMNILEIIMVIICNFFKNFF